MNMQLNRILAGIITVILLGVHTTYAQVPDDINGRLWRLAKVWGFAKYFHPNNCDVDWNRVLLEAIDSVLVSTSNEHFNQIISDVLEAGGTVPHSPDPLIIDSDINLNAHFDWINDPAFSQEVRDQLDLIHINFRPMPSCLIRINNFSEPEYTSWIDFRMDEINIPSFSYIDETNRMLVYFYYWNAINYFHADKDLMDQSWDTTLLQFIPVFREAITETDFHVRLINLATYLDDSHGFTGSPLTSAYFGSYYPLVKLDFVENETVVTKTSEEESDISVGDVVRKINGIDISELRDSLAQYSPASNDAVRMLNIHRRMLRGQFNSLVSLVLEDATGEIYTSVLTRDTSATAYFDWVYSNSNPTYNITECGYGYVDMGKLTVNQVPLMYTLLKNAPAIIFDIRNYPNGTLWSLIPYFYTNPKTWALLTEPDPTFPGWYYWIDNRYHAGVFNNPQAYTGKVIILANAETQSQAEYTVMGLQQHPKAFTIGSQTSGADGNISYLDLPGSLRTYWTSLGIYYPDSTTAQRVGVRIDSIVIPTIEDIRQGRDAELLAAFDCLVSSFEEPESGSNISIYPNPADEIIYVSSPTELTGNVKLKFFNTVGQQVLQQSLQINNAEPVPVDVSFLQNGICIISLSHAEGGIETIKIHIQH